MMPTCRAPGSRRSYNDDLGQRARKKIGNKHFNRRVRSALTALDALVNRDAIRSPPRSSWWLTVKRRSYTVYRFQQHGTQTRCAESARWASSGTPLQTSVARTRSCVEHQESSMSHRVFGEALGAC